MLICKPLFHISCYLLTDIADSIRFAPPLVISEEDLLKAVKIIGECLDDLDKVSLCLNHRIYSLIDSIHF